MILPSSKIYVIGYDLISKNLTDKLKRQGFKNILTTNFNLNDKQQVKEFFIKNKPEIIVLDPSKNTDPYIQNRIIFSGSLNQVKRIFKFNNFMHQKEFSKYITDIHYDEFYTNTYYPNNHIMEIVRTMHEGKVYGDMHINVESGLQKKNILYLEDLTDAITHIMKMENKGQIMNINNCCEMNLREMTFKLKEIIEYQGDIRFEDIDEEEKRPMLNINNFGWKAKYNFDSMMRRIYNNLIDRHKYFMVSSFPDSN